MTATAKAVWARQVTGHRHLSANLSSLKWCLSGCLGPGLGWGGAGCQGIGHSRLSAKHTRLECVTSAIIIAVLGVSRPQQRTRGWRCLPHRIRSTLNYLYVVVLALFVCLSRQGLHSVVVADLDLEVCITLPGLH